MRIFFAETKKLCKVSFKDSLFLARVPIITLKNNGKYFNFIIDTGATSSLINQSIINKLDYKEVDGNDLVSGLDPSVEYKTTKIRAIFKCDNEEFDIALGAIDLDATFESLKEDCGIEVIGLLGNDFLEEHKYILDYNKMIIYHK